MRQRAYERWTGNAPGLRKPPAHGTPLSVKELQVYVDRRKAEIPDAWY